MTTNRDEPNRTLRWKSVYDSWYPAPMLTEDEETYLRLIESVFKVKYPDGTWQHIKLTNHQAEFHRDDLAIQKFDAKNRVVIKSRGTSFTTDALISLCTAVYTYRDQLPPAVRINDTKVKELFANDFRDLIKHMTPLRIESTDARGNIVVDYFPFNSTLVEYTAHQIYLPDRNIRFTAYPANSTSSENIRGNRINFGLMDETNYILSFKNIDTAMLDATRGAILEGPDQGKVAYQATYGTTRKGKYTSFNQWFENIERLTSTNKLDKFKIYKWPALDPTKVDLERPLTEQTELVPIAPWQTLELLEQRRLAGLNTFKEEYMAMLTDEESMLYDMTMINNELLLDDDPRTPRNDYSMGERFVNEEGVWKIGVDPAYSTDFFAISIFYYQFYKEYNDHVWDQTYVFYRRKVDLTSMQDDCQTLLEHYIPLGLEFMEIDGNGLGVQLSNYLRKLFPEHVRLFRGTRIRLPGKNISSVPIKEFLHTNQIALQQARRVRYLPDPIQLMHFSGWNTKYEFETQGGNAQDMAHGDTTISNALALLPKNLNMMRYTGLPVLVGSTKSRLESDERKKEYEQEQKDFEDGKKTRPSDGVSALELEQRLKNYRKLRTSSIQRRI